MDWNLFLTIFFSVFILAQVDCLKQFELKVNEQGLKFNERLSFDVDANLQIVDVPAHHNRVATKYVKDLNNILQLQVRWVDRECLVSKILEPQESDILINALENQDLQSFVNYENATSVNIVEIEGPEMDHSEIPSSLRSYCPKDFKAKAIHLLDEKNIAEEDEEGFLIKDPDMNFDIKNHDPAPHVTDTLHFLSRRKRESCFDAYNREESDCHAIHVYCPGNEGCPAEGMYYRCERSSTSSYSCEYILTCSTAGGPNSAQCLKHYTAGGRRCRPCCKYYDCGIKMPRCASSSEGHCFQEQAAYVGYKRSRTYQVDNVHECQRKCQRKSWCQHFNFMKEEGEEEEEDGDCELQTRKGNFAAKPGKTGYKTGPRACP